MVHVMPSTGWTVGFGEVFTSPQAFLVQYLYRAVNQASV